MTEFFADVHREHSVMYDCIVVGAGAIGLGAAFQLAGQGYKTLLLEQFSMPHSRGSSGGLSRMYRNAYQEEHHMAMVREIKEMWEELERETGTTLHRETGLLVMEKKKNSPKVREVRQTMQKGNLPFLDLTVSDLRRRYPLMSYKGDYSIVLDPEAGFLIANKCLQTLQDQFLKRGGTLRDGQKVLKIEPGRIVTVHTSQGRQYKARGLVLTAGPWASQMLEPLGLDLPLKVWRVNVCFFKEKQVGSYLDYPMMSDDVGKGFLYCFPSRDYPGYMKFGYHLLWDEVDPSDRDLHRTDKVQVDIERIKQYVREHFPGLEAEPSIIETCMYTSTPGEDIIVDTHPVYHNIAIGCGFSGKGFKMAPMIGQILGDLAMGKPPKYDISPISITRFLNHKAKL